MLVTRPITGLGSPQARLRDAKACSRASSRAPDRTGLTRQSAIPTAMHRACVSGRPSAVKPSIGIRAPVGADIQMQPRGLDTVEDGHVHVKDCDVHFTAAEHLERLLPIADRDDLVAGMFQDARQDLSVGSIVVRDEDAYPVRSRALRRSTGYAQAGASCAAAIAAARRSMLGGSEMSIALDVALSDLKWRQSRRKRRGDKDCGRPCRQARHGILTGVNEDDSGHAVRSVRGQLDPSVYPTRAKACDERCSPR